MRRAALSILAIVLMSLGFASATSAQQTANPETIEIGLSMDHVMITAGFSGTDLTIFGAVDNADPLNLAYPCWMVSSDLPPNKPSSSRDVGWSSSC